MDDDVDLGRLRRIAGEIDGPPDLTVEAARAALLTRRLDAELAELVEDSSLLDATGLRGGDDEPRLLSFRIQACLIDLEVRRDDDTVSLRGLLTGMTGELTVESASGARVPAPLDTDGWFAVSRLPTGPLRIVVAVEGGSDVATRWVQV